jgi:hypothetical protein
MEYVPLGRKDRNSAGLLDKRVKVMVLGQKQHSKSIASVLANLQGKFGERRNIRTPFRRLLVIHRK